MSRAMAQTGTSLDQQRCACMSTFKTFSLKASAVYRYSIQHRNIWTPTMKGGVKEKASWAWLRSCALCSPRDSAAPVTNMMTPILSRKAWYSSFRRMPSFLCKQMSWSACLLYVDAHELLATLYSMHRGTKYTGVMRRRSKQDCYVV